ncbi:hypothetical protein CP10139811_1499 [Chlamydia ibidis]|uniref:Uncharacterized protein n=1 Tax=Chlamydia ibidis TaxID=1405396 RepID=S7J595_9CHLA|nr:hypothetical protein CP10139811_1499 [Chlamydia ibidis]
MTFNYFFDPLEASQFTKSYIYEMFKSLAINVFSVNDHE